MLNKEEIETRNCADGPIYQAERTLREMGNRVSASQRNEGEEKINGVRRRLTIPCGCAAPVTTWSASCSGQARRSIVQQG